MRIIAFGDIHMSLANFQKIPGIETADLLLITGDLTNFGHKNDAEPLLHKIQQYNKRILALAGNLDYPDVDTYLSEQGINFHGRGKIYDGLGIFGVGGSNPTPFNTPNEYTEGELQELLNKGYAQVKSADHLILVSHTPPHNTKTDMLNNGDHVGSRAVRQFIEEKQPDVCVTGHIHESRAEDAIGKTQIINPGMIRDGGWIELSIADGALTATLNTL